MPLRTIALFSLLLLAGFGCQQNATTSAPQFVADDGIRVEDASNPGAKIVDDELQLLYERRGNGVGGHAIAVASTTSDWLDFTEDTGASNDVDVFRAHRLPDGTWRAYGLDTTKGITGTCLKSQSSRDGVTYTDDAGCRYTLQADDNGTMGVYDFFNDDSGGVTLLYLGDMKGKNNVRRAYSTDNGETFTYQNGNVLGDDDAGGGAKSYVDQKTIRLADGTLFLVAMKEGRVYGFTSDDDGVSFAPMGLLLEADNFAIDDSVGLYDPQIVALPDGRYRIYVTLSVGNPGQRSMLTQHIVSATTR